MRLHALLLATLLTVAGGCLTGDEDAVEDVQQEATPEPLPPLPANFTQEVDVVYGADPYNFIPASTPAGGGGPCSAPQSSCSKFPFTLNRTATVTATLDWGMPSNDFDLYIVQDGADVSGGVGASSVGPGALAPHEEIATLSLDVGDYEVWVSHWAVVQETYTLVVEFT